MRKTYYQGHGTAFSKYDISKIGSGDNTHFYAQGHNFSESENVAEFYAERVNTNEGGFISQVSIDANLMEDGACLSPGEMMELVSGFYANDIEDYLIEHIQEQTEYEADHEQATEIAVGLLTGNESDVTISELMSDVGYTTWPEFQETYKEHLLVTFYTGLDRGIYDDVPRSLYSALNDKFDNDSKQVHEHLIRNMHIDGIQYDNYGNNGEECKNVAVWNDSSITIINQEMRFEPHVSMRPRR